MPVYVYEEDAFEKMVEVEGEKYRECRLEKAFDDHSFDAFLEKWNKLNAAHPKLKDLSPSFSIDINNSSTTIYGLHGWNRYVVHNTGEIFFIEHKATGPEAVRRAKEAGFRMF